MNTTIAKPLKIWIDISNSPHVMMFEGMIEDLKKNGFEVIITSRPLANTLDLLNQRGLEHAVIGEHYGKSLFKKALGYPIRCLQLYQFLKNKKIDAAIAQSSFHSPLVAWFLRIPSIYTNDNEHALGNIAGMLFARKLYFPESMNRDSILFKIPGLKRKTCIYPGIKESLYLWRKMENKLHVRKNHVQPYNIYFRPEPRTAQYYKGAENFLDDTISQLKNDNKVTVLARDKQQLTHYHEKQFKGIDVPDRPIKIDQILHDCDLFIGAGGSMTREVAILGIPTMSVYQDELLGVDKYLIDKGYMAHTKKLEKVNAKQLIAMLDENTGNGHLLEKGKKAYYMMLEDLIIMAKEHNHKKQKI